MLIPSETLDLPAIVINGKFEQWRNRSWRKNWMTSPQDRAALIYLLRSIAAESVAEIGINLGYTARCLLDNVTTIRRYIGIEVSDHYVIGSKGRQVKVPRQPGQAALSDPRLKLMLRERGSVDIKPEDLPTLDAMIIDGDHDHEIAKHDTKLAYATVRSGGLVIWHDYHEDSTEGVRDLLEELFSAGAPMKHIANTWLAFEKKE